MVHRPRHPGGPGPDRPCAAAVRRAGAVRRRPIAPFAHLAGCLAALALAAGATIAAEGDSSDRGRLVECAGGVMVWDGISPQMHRPPGGDPLSVPDVRAVVEVGPHLVALLGPAGSRATEGRHRREGEARLFDLSGEGARALRDVLLEGEPVAGVPDADGSSLYVAADRPGAQDGAAATGFVHAIDVGTGEVRDTAVSDRSIAAIVLEPSGPRLYASQPDRIQTFTTRPLIASWILRSPGTNGALALEPGTGTLVAARGREIALFDPREIAARSAAGRHARQDDATAVIPLPFAPGRVVVSDDGRLAFLSAPGVMAFVDLATQAIVWPGEEIPGLRGSEGALALSFPGAGRDLVLALVPSGAVAALRTPGPASPAVPPTMAAPAPAAAAPPPSPGTGPTQSAPPAAPEPEPDSAGPSPAPATATTPPAPAIVQPTPVQPAPIQPAPDAPPAPAATSAAPVPAAASEPAPAAATTPAVLAGKVTGSAASVHAIVLYGPDNILKEYARVPLRADGSWSIPLPPPGNYRIMAIGDGSTPLPVVPGFLSVKVTEGEGRQGLDFEMRPVR